MTAVAEMFEIFELETPTLPGLMTLEQELELEKVLDKFQLTRRIIGLLAIELKRSTESQQ